MANRHTKEEQKKINEVAATLRVARQTVVNWMNQGAPVLSGTPNDVKRWKKNRMDKGGRPRKTELAAGVRKSKQETLSEFASLDDGVSEDLAGDPGTAANNESLGAAKALKRLEVMEHQFYQRLQSALKTRQFDVIQLARDEWLKCSESLRKYDLLVEKSRRDSGDVIPRSECEEVITMATTWLRLSVQAMLSSEVPEILKATEGHQVQQIVESGLRSAVENCMEKSERCQSQLPEWAVLKIREGFAL